MKKLNQTLISTALTVFLVVLLLFTFSSFAQDKSDDALKKKYAAILGDWNVKAEGSEGESIITFYVENGALWIMGNETSEMDSVKGKELEFTADYPDGLWEIKFIRDENGKISKCKLENDTMGISVTATKKEKKKR